MLNIFRSIFLRLALAATAFLVTPLAALASEASNPRDVTGYAQGAMALVLVAIIAAVLWIPGRRFPEQRRRGARSLILFYLPALAFSWVVTMYLSFGILKLIHLSGYTAVTNYSGGAGLVALLLAWVVIAIVLDTLACMLLFRLRPHRPAATE